MKHKVFMVNSITTAFKGRDLLQNKGINVRVERAPRHLNPGSCGYAIFLNSPADSGRAEAVMRGSGIQHKTADYGDGGQ